MSILTDEELRKRFARRGEVSFRCLDQTPTSVSVVAQALLKETTLARFEADVPASLVTK